MKSKRIAGMGSLMLTFILILAGCNNGSTDPSPSPNDDSAMTWTAVSDSPFSSSIDGVAYGGTSGQEKFVAFVSTKIATSLDGETWTAAVSISAFDHFSGLLNFGGINDVVYGGGKWVGVGNYGKIATSPDGETWTAVSNSTFSYDINSVVYGGISGQEKFVAFGTTLQTGSYTMATSLDGETWTQVTNISAFSGISINSVTYGDGKWVAVGRLGTIATSPDAETWTAVSNSTFSSAMINSVAYGSGKFVAFGTRSQTGSYEMATSSNGETWTQVSNNTFSYAINSVAYGGSKFVALETRSQGRSNRMATSSDGETWTQVSNSIFETDSINGVTYGGGKWVAVGGNGKIVYSSN